MHAHSRTQRRPVRRQKEQLVLRDVDGKGRGVFAARSIDAGEEVLEFLGEVKDVADYTDLTHALQVGPRAFLGASGAIDDYVNHSCEPNCGVREEDGRIFLFAFRRIRVGEEISFDYSTTQEGDLWLLECQCGTPRCRGLITDFIDLPATLKTFYLSRNAVLPYIQTER